MMSGEAYGIAAEFSVPAPAQAPRIRAASASPATGSLATGDAERVAASFVEDLFRLGRVAVPQEYLTPVATVDAEAVRTPTHHIIRADDRLVLARRVFD